MNRTFLTLMLLVALIVFATAASALGDASWVSVNGQTSPEKPTAVVLSSNGHETIIKFTISGFWSELFGST